FTGAIDVHAVSPAFTQPLARDNGATMRWSGLTADIHIANGRVTYSAQLPQYAYSHEPVSIALKNIALQGTGPARRIPASDDDWNSDTQLTVGRLLFDSDDAQAELTIDINIDSGLDNEGDYGMTGGIQVSDAVVQRLDNTQT